MQYNRPPDLEDLTGQPEGIRADLAAALSALDEETAAGLVGWRPPSWLWQDTGRDVDAVLAHTKLSLALAGPRDRRLMVRDLWPLFCYMEWCQENLGDLSFEVVFARRNLNAWLVSLGKERSTGWKQRARSVVRRVGRTLNPAGWHSDETMSTRPITAAYSPGEEAVLRLEAGLPGRPNPGPLIAIAFLTLGTGLKGSEAVLIRPTDLLERPDGRIEVQVSGPHPRRVPIRGDYTDLARRATALAKPNERLIPGCAKNTPYTAAKRINVKGLGTLSPSRARSTWLTAHLLAGTPLPALRYIAGPLSANTLTDLMEAAAAAMDPDEAVEGGLGA